MSIRNKLKENETIYFFYKRVKLGMNKIYYVTSQEKFTKKLFYKTLGYNLNLQNPKTFNEKIQWLKFNKMTQDYIDCADKYKLRNYIKEKFPQYIEYFPKLLATYKNAKEINLNDLPNKFVLKCNHGCGFNFICTDKNHVAISQLKKKVSRWMKTNYEYVACESQYHYMPKIIYVEEFINSFNSKIPTDYKFYCFNGKIKIIMVCLDRIGDHASEYHYLNKKWEPLLIDKKVNLEKTKLVEKPVNYDKMVEISENLSKSFDFVRIDFYDTENKPIIGEMTFTPGGGIDSDYDYETDKMLGDMLKIHKNTITD